MLGSTLAPGDKDLLAQAAVWALSETSEGALNSVDIVVTGNELGLVREHAAGQPFRALLRQCMLSAEAVPSKVVLRLALDVLETLNETTSKPHRLASGVSMHCGLLGPDFLWITSDGRTLLTDLGVSAALRATGPFAGLADLVAYSAPEQLEGTLDDLRSDIFVLGVLLWELLSGGRRLFQGSDPSEVAAAVNSARIVAPVSSVAIEADTVAIVMRALERDLGQRFQGPQEMRQAIAGLAPAAVASRTDVAALLAEVSGSELAAQEEARRVVVGRTRSGKNDAPEAPEAPEATPASPSPRPAQPSSAVSSPVSSPPPKPTSTPLSQPPASIPSSSPASPSAPVSVAPVSLPPQTGEVDSGWDDDEEQAEQPAAAPAPAAAAAAAQPELPLAAAESAGPDSAAPTPATAAIPVSEGTGAPEEPSLRVAPETAQGALVPKDATAQPASTQASTEGRSTAARAQSGGARFDLPASATPLRSHGPVVISDLDVSVLAAESRLRPRWQVAATAAFLVLAAVFLVVGLLRKPSVPGPKSVSPAAEITKSAAPPSVVAPATQAIAAPSQPVETAQPAPAEEPARDAKAEDGGTRSDTPDGSAFAAAFAKHVSGSASPAKSDTKKKAQGAQAAKPAASGTSSDPLDVLRRLESQRRGKKEAKTGAE